MFENENSGIKLDNSYKNYYIDDLLILGDETVREEDKNFDERTINNSKINLFLAFVFFCFFILIFRIQNIRPTRGVVYDRKFKKLVVNIPAFSLKIIQADLPKDEAVRIVLIKEISELIKESEGVINNLLDENKEYFYQPVIIKENIDYEDALLLYVKSINMPGVLLEKVSRRAYISNEVINSISHILGYNGKISREELAKNKDNGYLLDDYIGKSGIELSFEKELRGELGRSQIETNALGKQIRVIAKNDAVSGVDLILSIDLEFQNYIESLLKEELEKIKKKNASIVVMDPRNGEIISMVSYPSFNNNLFAGGISVSEYEKLINDEQNPLFNRAISGAYPPGSTFKPIIAAMALDEGIIRGNTKVSSVGGIWVGQWFFPDWLSGGHGSVNVKSAIANSVNTFFYYIGGGYKDFEGLGIEAIVDKAQLFNLGNKTGINLPSESSGFMPSVSWKEEKFNEPWYIGDTYHVAIGQGYMLLTPLQSAVYTSFFANGGVLYKPKIVKAITYEVNVAKELPNEYIEKDIISKKNVELVREGMRGTVVYGSARSLGSLPFSAAGKTGTAQFSNEKDPHAWFTCFAPYEKPTIAISVLIEEGGEGSAVAVPIARKILEYWWEHK